MRRTRGSTRINSTRGSWRFPTIDAADPTPYGTRASLTVDIYRSREAADAELRDAIEDEPDWAAILSVIPLDLPEPHPN